MSNEPTDAMKRNHVITTASQIMKIMVDLSPWVKDSSVLDTRDETCDERVICSIKVCFKLKIEFFRLQRLQF